MKHKKHFSYKFVAKDGNMLIDSDTDLLSLLNRIPEHVTVFFIPEGRCIFSIKRPNNEFTEEIFNNECFLCEIFNPTLNLQSSYYTKSEYDAVQIAVEYVRKGMEVEIWELKRRFKPRVESRDLSESFSADTDISDTGAMELEGREKSGRNQK